MTNVGIGAFIFLGKSENDEVFFGGRVKTLPYASHPINNNYVNNQH